VEIIIAAHVKFFGSSRRIIYTSIVPVLTPRLHSGIYIKTTVIYWKNEMERISSFSEKYIE